MEKTRYACNAYVDPRTYKDIRALEEEIYTVTGAKRYMTQWEPHVTVGSGNELNTIELNQQKLELQEVAKRHQPFSAHIGPIKYRINEVIAQHDSSYLPYQVFLEVAPSENLTQMVRDIEFVLHRYNVFYDISKPRASQSGYWPHIGLASRDLTREDWEMLQEKFKTKEFERNATISHFSLFISPTGVQGLDTSTEIARFTLGSGNLKTENLHYPIS